MTAPDLMVETSGPIGRITFNRPEKLNALTREMYVGLGTALRRLGDDPGVRVIVLRGAGRAFSAGFDLSMQVANQEVEEKRRFLNEVANANRWAIWNSPKPVIAQVHGYCLAGALELILPCDFIVASEECEFGEPEILFGAGAAFLMVPWLVNARVAKRILMIGERFTAGEALDWGLVTKVVPLEDLDAHVESLAAHLAKLPMAALSVVKEGINRAYEVRGMRTSIDEWVDTSLLLSSMESDEVVEFKKKVSEVGVKAAVRWRDGIYSAALAKAAGSSENS